MMFTSYRVLLLSLQIALYETAKIDNESNKTIGNTQYNIKQIKFKKYSNLIPTADANTHHSIREITNATAKNCGISCYQENNCWSFLFFRHKTPPTCTLIDGPINRRHVSRNSSVDYYEIWNHCSSNGNICNLGVCVPNYNTDSYTCHCPSIHTGAHCETNVTPTAGNGAGNGTEDAQATDQAISTIAATTSTTASTVTESSVCTEKDVILLNEILPVGCSLMAGAYKLIIMQEDGNLLILNTQNGDIIWTTSTAGQNIRDGLLLQDDGNLILYRTDGSVAWSTDTGGRGVTQFQLQVDGNFVGSKENGRSIWSSLNN